jgi:hypothetical protein
MNIAVERDMSLMKQHLVITHTILQNEIPGFLGSWVKNTPSVKMCPPPPPQKKKKLFVLTFS